MFEPREKTGVEMTFLGLKLGQDLGNPVVLLHQEFLGIPPRVNPSS